MIQYNIQSTGNKKSSQVLQDILYNGKFQKRKLFSWLIPISTRGFSFSSLIPLLFPVFLWQQKDILGLDRVTLGILLPRIYVEK